MNFKINSTPKTTVMPVRLCDLNLSDIEDDDDDVDNDQNTKELDKENETHNKDLSYKTFEQINMKFSEKKLITPLKHSNVCTPQLQDKKAVVHSSQFNRSELYKTGVQRFGLQTAESSFTIKENEIFSTPYNRKIDENIRKSAIKINKDPQKLIFSPASNIGICNQNTSINKEGNDTHNSNQVKIPIQKTKPLLAEKSIRNERFLNKQLEFKNTSSIHEISGNNLLDDSHNKITGIYEIKNSTEDGTLPSNNLKYILQNAKETQNNTEEATLPISNLKQIQQNAKETQNNTEDTTLPSSSIKFAGVDDKKSIISKPIEPKEVGNFKIPELLPHPSSDKNIETSNKVCRIQNKNGVLSKIILEEKSYDVSKKLGSGGSSVVYLAIDSCTLVQSAIKMVNLSADPSLVEGYMNEVKLLSRLQGSDVVIKMLNYVHVPDDKMLYMVMECGESDFSHIIKMAKSNNQIPFPIVILVKYWLQMLEAVKFIHDNGIIHSDLKPANFLKVGQRLKLIDFGIASSISNDCTSIIKHVQTGTFNYMSPEALQDTSSNSAILNKLPNIKISFKSDVWSLGCILYLLLYGNTPFGHLTRYCVKMAAITDPNSKIDFPELELYPPILIKTAKRCLVHNPYDRPTVAELLQLPREPFKCPENNL